jgi:hypothetical protein
VQNVGLVLFGQLLQTQLFGLIVLAFANFGYSSIRKGNLIAHISVTILLINVGLCRGRRESCWVRETIEKL